MSQDAVKKPSDLEIMMYLDGELSDTDGQMVARWLEDDRDAARKAEALGQMGEMLRTSLELEADDAEPRLAGLWAGIDTGINANGASKKKTNAQESASASSAAVLAEKRATDALVKKAGWFAGWQGHVTTGALVAAAVAIVMYVARPERIVETGGPVQQASSDVKSSKGATMPVSLESQAPEVEELEVYGGTGIIMTVHGEGSDEDDDSSAVIWISNDTDVVEEPI